MQKAPLSEELHNVELLRNKKVRLEDELKQVEFALSGHILKACEAIVAGETTGRRLYDFIIQAHGVLPELYPVYEALEARLRGKKGEFLLIRYPTKVRVRYGGHLRPGDCRNETHFRITLLKGEELQLRHGTLPGMAAITLPAQSYLQGVWPNSFLYKLEVARKAERGDLFEWTSSHPPTLWEYLSNEEHGKNLFIGDKEVREQFKEMSKSELFLSVAGEMLGRLILTPTEG